MPVVDASFPRTIPDLLAWRAARAGDRPWLRFEGTSFTVRDVIDASACFAAGLAERGVTKGDRVGILVGNAPEHLFAWFGANMLGAIAAPSSAGVARSGRSESATTELPASIDDAASATPRSSSATTTRGFT